MIEVIPAIDLIGGRCVRLQQGSFDKRVTYDVDPIGLAIKYKDTGCKRLHIVDLEGAQKGQPVHLELIAEISEKSGLMVQSGGGIKTFDDFQRAMDNGVSKVILGSMAVQNPTLFNHLLQHFGSDRIVLAADVLNGNVMISGWEKSSDLPVRELIQQYHKIGLSSVLVTDIQRDGMLEGPSTDLYVELQQSFPLLEIIASGGVSNNNDLEILNNSGIKAVVVGKALFEGRITLNQLKDFL